MMCQIGVIWFCPVYMPSLNIIFLHCFPSIDWNVLFNNNIKVSNRLLWWIYNHCENGCEIQSFLAATKQLYEWYFLSVCPSVRLSVCPSVRLSVRLSVCPSVRLSVCPSVTPFWLCSHHRIIMKFSGVITLDQGKVHAKGQGQRSKVKVTEVTTQIFVSGL